MGRVAIHMPMAAIKTMKSKSAAYAVAFTGFRALDQALEQSSAKGRPGNSRNGSAGNRD